MPTSPTGNKGRVFVWAPAGAGALPRERESGFTLVELMIVVTIIGLASAAVIWSLPDPRGRLLDEANRFAVRTCAAHDLAVVNAQSVSMWVSPGGYGFDQRERGAWVPIVQRPLKVTPWSKGTQALPVAGAGRDRVLFDSTGLADRPLDVTLVRDAERVTVHVGAGGEVKVGG